MAVWLAQEPVGLDEIARRIGVNKGTLTAMRGRGQLPKERGTLSARAPWWYWGDLVPWAVERGYLTVEAAKQWDQAPWPDPSEPWPKDDPT